MLPLFVRDLSTQPVSRLMSPWLASQEYDERAVEILQYSFEKERMTRRATVRKIALSIASS